MADIAAYILTIDSIAERAANARSLAAVLDRFGELEEAEIVPAVYWRDEGASLEFIRANPDIRLAQGYLQKCKQGQLCATFSHIRIWQKLLESHHAGALVFEDDIYVSDETEFRKTLQALPRHPQLEFLRLHLFRTFRDEILATAGEQVFVDDPSRWGFATYYISRAGAAKLLQRFRWIDDNVDIIVPRIGMAGELNCKTVRRVLVEHHPFTGNGADLQQRHELERRPDKLQKEASTIWTSQRLVDDRDLHERLSGLAGQHAVELREKGYTTLRGVFDADTVQSFRERILQHRSLLKNTRPSSSALHLAGFHRFPELEPLHTQVAGNPVVRRLLEQLGEGETLQSIGLSDITINRSQCWHKDLLRGKFRQFLDDGGIPWSENGGGVFKILFYLQSGASLRVIRGSHRVPVPLEHDASSEPEEGDVVDSLPVEPGDVVVMDIRMSHRGASEDAYLSGQWDDNPRILVSTALGFAHRPLTRAMEIGNFHRLMDWNQRNS